MVTDERQAGLREALIAYLRDTLEDTALLIDDHRAGKETDKRWGWFADGILAALAVAQVPAQGRCQCTCYGCQAASHD